MIDLRSDTVTKPTQAMKDAMMAAPVGDDVFDEDPTVHQLQSRLADMFGKEAGLFCSSGVQTNQIGIRLHTEPGSEVICHKESHIYNYEGGGIMVNSLSSVKLLEGNRGRINSDDIEPAINPDDVHKPVTRLVSVEDTSNRGGGCCYDFNDLVRIGEIAKKNGLPYHLDGARVFNALTENGIDTQEYGKPFDTISICLSKGLGAPIGSVLLGTEAHIRKARRIRKVLGGGMRQVGIIAAAGLYALDHHVDRLKEDHHRAKMIADCLQERSYVSEVFPVETNIVVFRVANGSAAMILEPLKEKGVLAVPFGPDLVRFVTHLDFNDNQLNDLITILKSIDA